MNVDELIRRFFGAFPITQGYGVPNAGTRQHEPHTGIDIGEPRGTPIREIDPVGGRIIREYSDPVGGLQEEVLVTGGYHEIFAHLSAVPDNIAKQLGAGRPVDVKPGDVIAYSGDSGAVTGPHLHFEVHDPLGGLVDPITHLQREYAIDPSKFPDARDIPVVGGAIDVGGAAAGSSHPASTLVGQIIQGGTDAQNSIAKLAIAAVVLGGIVFVGYRGVKRLG